MEQRRFKLVKKNFTHHAENFKFSSGNNTKPKTSKVFLFELTFGCTFNQTQRANAIENILFRR